MIKLSKIKANPDNPRLIKDDKFKKLCSSIQDFPKMMALRPMVVNAQGMVLGGNMRLKALQELKFKEVPDEWVKKASNLTPDEVKRFIAADNIGFGDWDWDALANGWDLEELTEWGLDIPDFAFPKEAVEDDFIIPDEIETDIVLGDLFEIGQHRLLCGDSTKAKDVERLMDGQKADMVFTDPPYGVAYSARTGIRSGKIRENMKMIKNDDLSGVELDNLIIESIKNCVLFTKGESPFYICNNWHCAEVFKNALTLLNLNIDAWIIWNKDWMSVGHGHYRSNHEFIFYSSRKSKFYAQKGIENDVWTIRKLSPTNKTHTTEKPVTLSARAINNSSKSEDIILDLFLGSGSTMVAAHQLNRKCYGMEIDPKYCQVIVDRMLKLDPALEIKKNGICITQKENVDN